MMDSTSRTHAPRTPKKPKHPQPPLRKVEHNEWVKVATSLYGDKATAWRFRCVACGHVQSVDNIRAIRPSLDLGDWRGWIHFSCIGRRIDGVGCDWSLGGLFKIHTVQVAFEGEPMPTFEFAEASVLGAGYFELP